MFRKYVDSDNFECKIALTGAKALKCKMTSRKWEIWQKKKQWLTKKRLEASKIGTDSSATSVGDISRNLAGYIIVKYRHSTYVNPKTSVRL